MKTSLATSRSMVGSRASAPFFRGDHQVNSSFFKPPDVQRKRGQERPGSRGTVPAGNFLPQDVEQGGLADCYLMAVLLSLTRNDAGRAILRQNIRKIDESRYRVRLYRIGRRGRRTTFQPEWFDVSYPGEGDGAHRAAPWVRVMELAYADLYGGTDVMAGSHGGTRIGGPGRAYEHITGRSAEMFFINEEANTNRLWRRIRRALRSGRHVVAGTPRNLDTIDDRPPGLIGGHNYAVLSVAGRGDDRRIYLRNPWNSRVEDEIVAEMEGVSNHPEFSIPFADFVRVFVQVAIDNVPERQSQSEKLE